MSLFSTLNDALPRSFKTMLRKFRFFRWIHRMTVLRSMYLNEKISGITIELTDRCNLLCSYCPKSEGIGIGGRDIDFELFKRVVLESFDLAPIKRVILVGFGEPLLYQNLEEAIAFVKQVQPSVEVTLTSNAVLLTKERMNSLLTAGLTQITLSVNATSREQYKTINQADLYDKVVQNVKDALFLANSRPNSIRILVQVLKGPNAKDDIERFKGQWTPFLGSVGEIQIQPYVNWAGQVADLPEEANRTKKDPYPCAHVQSSWIITREGDALACCMVFPSEQGDLALGNIKNSSLKEIYFGDKIRRLRKMNASGELYNLNPCRTCNAPNTVPNVWFRNPFSRWFGPKWI